jgi:hypothetical protein
VVRASLPAPLKKPKFQPRSVYGKWDFLKSAAKGAVPLKMVGVFSLFWGNYLSNAPENL